MRLVINFLIIRFKSSMLTIFIEKIYSATCRYRNFRTMTSPTPVQFSSVCCDASGEVVAAGTTDTFQVTPDCHVGNCQPFLAITPLVT